MKIRNKRTGIEIDSPSLCFDREKKYFFDLDIKLSDKNVEQLIHVTMGTNKKQEDTLTSKKENPFKRITDTMVDTYTKKNKDYGDSFATSVEKYGLIAALTRMSDKFNRCENLVLNNEDNKVTDEKLQDTLLDLASYAVMTIIELNKKDNSTT